MNAAELRITAEPVDEQRCKFVSSVPLLEAGARRFGSAAEAAGSALAEAVLAVPGVTELLVSGHTATVTKDDPAPWQVTGKAVGAAIRAAFGSGAPLVAARAAGADAGEDDRIYSRVADVFERRINPMVSGHGGRVDLIDVQDGVVMLRLQGGCQGCGMAEVTLRQGIETTLRETVAEVKAIVDVTDHGSGTNPYFAAAKK
jgi:Fe-S cluster biogenesis protein NfuA